MFLNLELRKNAGIVSNVSIDQMKKKKNTKSSNHLFFSTLPMTFLKNEKICYFDIMDQT